MPATAASPGVKAIAQLDPSWARHGTLVLLARAGTSFTWNNSDLIENTLYLRGRLRGTLRAWAEEALTDSGYRPAEHHLYLVSELENLSNGRYDRLMILMPPGSAKSTYALVNTDLWGAYVPTPPTPGSWYTWAEGLDGSAPTVSPSPFLVQ